MPEYLLGVFLFVLQVAGLHDSSSWRSKERSPPGPPPRLSRGRASPLTPSYLSASSRTFPRPSPASRRRSPARTSLRNTVGVGSWLRVKRKAPSRCRPPQLLPLSQLELPPSTAPKLQRSRAPPGGSEERGRPCTSTAATPRAFFFWSWGGCLPPRLRLHGVLRSLQHHRESARSPWGTDKALSAVNTSPVNCGVRWRLTYWTAGAQQAHTGAVPHEAGGDPEAGAPTGGGLPTGAQPPQAQKAAGEYPLPSCIGSPERSESPSFPPPFPPHSPHTARLRGGPMEHAQCGRRPAPPAPPPSTRKRRLSGACGGRRRRFAGGWGKGGGARAPRPGCTLFFHLFLSLLRPLTEFCAWGGGWGAGSCPWGGFWGGGERRVGAGCCRGSLCAWCAGELDVPEAGELASGSRWTAGTPRCLQACCWPPSPVCRLHCLFWCFWRSLRAAWKLSYLSAFGKWPSKSQGSCCVLVLSCSWWYQGCCCVEAVLYHADRVA